MQFLTPTEVRQRLRISKTTLVRRIKCAASEFDAEMVPRAVA